MNKVAFLDRDGVINFDKGYVGHWGDFEFMPGVYRALKRLLEHGYKLVIITNQSGIARGYFTTEDYQKLTKQYLKKLKSEGIEIAKVYYCPHHKLGRIPEFSFECDCRKPRTGMIRKAEKELGIDLENSVLFGDKASDILAGISAGVGKIFFISSCLDHEYILNTDIICCPNLKESVDTLII